MKKLKNGFVKNLHYICVIGVIAIGLLTIVGTGGGGDGNPAKEDSGRPGTRA